MIEYPKIETLYARDPKTFKVIPTQLRLPEFDLPKRWLITEKVDGTNIRINWNGSTVLIGGRTDNAQLPTPLVSALTLMFPASKLDALFSTDVTLYGEGYGGKIQKGGIYRPDPSFRLFDVRIGDWWLHWDGVESVAAALGIATVPVIAYEWTARFPQSYDELERMMGGDSSSIITEGGTGGQAEGIVARTEPLLLMRDGRRLMFKLKFKDF